MSGDVASERLDPSAVTRLSASILGASGTPEDVAAAVAGWLVRADAAGHHSHGVVKTEDYVGRIERGELVPDARPLVARDEDQLVLVDGRMGYGLTAAELLTRRMIDRVSDRPVVLGGIIDASHTGRLGEWAELAASAGVILFMCTASLERGSVAAYGARQPALGTNPLTVAVPAGADDALVLDFATSAVAGAKTKHLEQIGAEAPLDSLLDRDGNPTTDPAALRAGGMLLPFGGHKGYGLSVLVSVLGGCVVGAAGTDPSKHGVFAIAVDEGAFAPRADVQASVRRQLDRLRGLVPRDGVDQVLVPGDAERRSRVAAGDGLVLPAGTHQRLVALARRLGVPIE